ncbi:MAG TPA: hypothetical protein VFS54_06080 [Solirubrobacterales bacterium]|nr:hypothetical protein [Solirubrobacterales bacterium]
MALVPLTAFAVIIATLKRQENAIDRALDDPPRRDFTVRTRARSRRYLPGRLGTSDTAVATDLAAIATLRVAAYLEAMVRADERSQGAHLAGDKIAAEERTREAMDLLERARAAEALKAERLRWLGGAWAELGASPEFATQQAEPNPEALAKDGRLRPAFVAREARRTGLVVGDLDLRIEPETAPGEKTSDILFTAARRTRSLADASNAVFEDARSEEARRLVATALPAPPPPEYEQGLRARSAGLVDQAMRLFEQAADRGSPDAMFELAERSLEQERLVEARDWFRRASDATQRNVARATHSVELSDLYQAVDPYKGYFLPSPPRKLPPGEDID